MKNKQRAGVHVVPKPAEQKAPQAFGPMDDAWMKKIVPVLEGKAPPPNEFVAYLADQVRTATDERTTVLANLRQITNQATQLKERIMALDGQVNGRLNDIRAWWDRKSPVLAEGKPFLIKPESEDKNVGSSNPKS